MLYDTIRLELYDGHTPGQIVVLFDTEEGNFAFPGDVVPTSLNIALSWLSAYDDNLSLAMDEKKRFLDKAKRSIEPLFSITMPIHRWQNCKREFFNHLLLLN